MNILDSLQDFHDLGKLNEEELNALCGELRDKILNVTLKNGGHLSASLGVVELTVALLRAFNPDRDKLIFDVGHQSYAYKILTKRKDSFATLRQKGGIAGFSRLNESPYDFFTTGHSSTSISAALGYAKARDLCKQDYESVAIIGDGALLNGVAFEALNSVDNLKTKVIIVLNDNKMSINPRIGGMAKHLAELATNQTYVKLKNAIKSQCRSMENGECIRDRISGIKSRLKSLLLPMNVFEDMNISYWGPFDGHNVSELESVFNLAKIYDESVLIHVVTKKGKGFEQTEKYASFFHGIGPGTDINDAEKPSCGTPGWSGVMADTLCKMAETDDKIVVCTAAMKDGTKLGKFSKLYPGRFFDVGIAEEHALVYAAGLAAAGMKPVVCIYSTFLQRAADQIVHDVALQRLPVLLGIDRAGLVGEDGETHHGLLDVSWLRAVPEMTIAVPRDAEDLKFFVSEWSKRKIPMAVRYPRGKASISTVSDGKTRESAEWGRSEILRNGVKICLIGAGSTVDLMLKAACEIEKRTSISVTVVDLRFVKPLDEEGLDRIFLTHKVIITAEENGLVGGWGEAIAAYKELKGYYDTKIASVGVPDKFISHASRQEQWQMCGLTAENIADIAAKLL